MQLTAVLLTTLLTVATATPVNVEQRAQCNEPGKIRCTGNIKEVCDFGIWMQSPCPKQPICDPTTPILCDRAVNGAMRRSYAGSIKRE